MRVRRHILITFAVFYVVGIAWGNLRLPWAAIKSLSDYELTAKAPAVNYSGLKVSSPQLWYLKHSLRESPLLDVPSVSASVTWNVLFLARVKSSLSFGPKGAELQDSVYLCIFGAWVSVYTYSHWMS